MKEQEIVQGLEKGKEKDAVAAIRISEKWEVHSPDPEGWSFEAINQYVNEWGWEIELPASLVIRKKDGSERKKIDLIREKSVPETNQTQEDRTEFILPALSDTQKELIKLIGEGMSVSAEIKKAIKDTVSGTTIHRNLKDLAEKGFLEYRKDVNYPGVRGVSLYRLSAKGKTAYRNITGEDPVEPEMDRMRRFHVTHEHGYGIRACQQLLVRSERYKDVEMFTDEVKLSDGSSYRPDLVCTRYEGDNRIVEYFMYEHGRQTYSDYYKKFDRMAMLSDEINIIVSSPVEQERMQRLLATWAKTKKKTPGYSQKIIRLTNYNRIKDRVDNNKPYQDWWYIEGSLGSFKQPVCTEEDSDR